MTDEKKSCSTCKHFEIIDKKSIFHWGKCTRKDNELTEEAASDLNFPCWEVIDETRTYDCGGLPVSLTLPKKEFERHKFGNNDIFDTMLACIYECGYSTIEIK